MYFENNPAFKETRELMHGGFDPGPFRLVFRVWGGGGGWGLGLRKIEPFTLNPETPTFWLGLLLVAEAIEDIRNMNSTAASGRL